jgi:hypothetical protein
VSSRRSRDPDRLVTTVGVLPGPEHKLSTRLAGEFPAARELEELLKRSGGRQEARTPDLRVANAALSQLS